MIRNYLALIFSVVTFMGVTAQAPDWVSYESRVKKYSKNIFFLGFVSQNTNRKQDQNVLKDKMMERAKSALSESIKVKIESSIVNQLSNLNSVSVEDFKKISRSYSSIEIAGIQSDFHLSKNKKEAFAFVWVRKTKVRSFYRNKIETDLSHARNKIEHADELLESGSRVGGLNELQEALILVRAVEEAQTILIVSGENDAGTLKYKESLTLKKSITAKLNQIKSNHDLSLNELAFYLVNQLKLKNKNVNKLQTENIFYKDTEMSSQLSARFNDILRHHISNQNVAVFEHKGPTEIVDFFTLEGSYWNDSSELQIILNLFQKIGNKRLLRGSAEGWITLETLKGANLKYIPQNYEEAWLKNEILNENVIENDNSELYFWTNKGVNGPIFKEGELLNVFVNAPQSGYLRLLNYWVDGSQLLLQDNYFISEEDTNKNIKLPIEWETSCPCGVEYLQVIVQSEPFDNLKTEETDGFLFLKDPIRQVIKDSRGFKENLNGENAFMAEKTISLTTLE